jgi:hypothetical protein
VPSPLPKDEIIHRSLVTLRPLGFKHLHNCTFAATYNTIDLNFSVCQTATRPKQTSDTYTVKLTLRRAVTLYLSYRVAAGDSKSRKSTNS